MEKVETEKEFTNEGVAAKSMNMYDSHTQDLLCLSDKLETAPFLRSKFCLFPFTGAYAKSRPIRFITGPLNRGSNRHYEYSCDR